MAIHRTTQQVIAVHKDLSTSSVALYVLNSALTSRAAFLDPVHHSKRENSPWITSPEAFKLVCRSPLGCVGSSFSLTTSILRLHFTCYTLSILLLSVLSYLENLLQVIHENSQMFLNTRLRKIRSILIIHSVRKKVV